MVASGIVFSMLNFSSMPNRVKRTTAYQDIKRGSEFSKSFTLRINIAKARRNKLTLKEKINLIDY